jgi:glucose dehydrogenase
VRSLAIVSLLLALVAQTPPPAGLPVTVERLLDATAEPGNWLTYSGDYRSHHYSGLNQITTANVHRLKAKWIRWEHRINAPPWAGVLSTAGNLVFSATPSGNFYALDARTGKELWHFNGGDKVYASPITFRSRGKQVITLPIGDLLIAFGVD